MSGATVIPVGSVVELDDLLAAGVLPNLVTLENSHGSNLVFGNVCYVHTDDTVKKAQSDGTAPEAISLVLCVNPSAIANGDEGLFLPIDGLVDMNGVSSGTPGQLIYLSATAGAFQTTLPSYPTNTYSVILGRWITSRYLRFNPDLNITPLTP